MITLFTTSGIMTAQWENLHDEIEKSIRFESGIDFNLVPGLVVGVWDQDSIYYFTFGHGVTIEDIFELGSLTKPVTAFLVDFALKSWDTNAANPIYPFFHEADYADNWFEITIDQILDHKAGLPRDFPVYGLHESDADDPYSHITPEMLTSLLAQVEPVPGRYSYSHIGYAALRNIFEMAGGLEYISGVVLNDGLGISGMYWQLADAMMVQGHGFDGAAVPLWHTNAMTTALGLKSDMPAMIQWLRFISQRIRQTEDLKKSSWKKALELQKRSGVYKVNRGWFLIRSGAHLAYYHTGRTGGHQASAVYIPELDMGIAVFANGVAGSNDLCWSILSVLKRSRSPKNRKS